jgi:hypothetical protein
MLNAITLQVRIVLIPPFNIHLFESVNYYFIVFSCISDMDASLKHPLSAMLPIPPSLLKSDFGELAVTSSSLPVAFIFFLQRRD